MVMVEKEQHLKMRMEHIRFGKEELVPLRAGETIPWKLA